MLLKIKLKFMDQLSILLKIKFRISKIKWIVDVIQCCNSFMSNLTKKFY